jgi:hypothetical protein
VGANRRPDPEPLETNDVAIVTVGTAAWAVALGAILLLGGGLDDGRQESWAWVCAAGVFLGLIGIRYVRRRRTAMRAGARAERPAG